MNSDKLLTQALKLPVQGSCGECRHVVDAHTNSPRCARFGYRYTKLVNRNGDCKGWAPRVEGAAAHTRMHTQASNPIGARSFGIRVTGIFLFALVLMVVVLVIRCWPHGPAPATARACPEDLAQAMAACIQESSPDICRVQLEEALCRPVPGFRRSRYGTPIPCTEALTPEEKALCGQP